MMNSNPSPRISRRTVALLLCALLSSVSFVSADETVEDFRHHVEKFNTMEKEGVVNAIPDAEAWEWMKKNVPTFGCSDKEFEEIYWFRWWALRKQLKRDPKSGNWAFTEFITKKNPISSGLGHHLMEGRWLRDQSYYDEYMLYWLRGNDGKPQQHLHKYSQWFTYALWSRWMVTQDTEKLVGLLDELVADYNQWEETQMREDGLFWRADVRDAMEESISGGRTVKNVRPTISVYMFGNAKAVAEIARLAGRKELAEEYDAKAVRLRSLIQDTLWNKELVFFGSMTEQLKPIKVREAIGFIPWYFDLPEPNKSYEEAWKQFTDEKGFKAPYGTTTAERRHPDFRSHGTGTCEWDGAVWPFATSQTLTALAKVVRDYPQSVVTKEDWFDSFRTYTRSHEYDGLPYIGEYLDESTGAWLKGRNPRSFYYNHSTYADMLITGLVGLRPRADDTLVIDPLLPEKAMDWFRLDRVRYHGHDLTIIWDRDGKKYDQGAGLQVLVDGEVLVRSDGLKRITAKLP